MGGLALGGSVSSVNRLGFCLTKHIVQILAATIQNYSKDRKLRYNNQDSELHPNIRSERKQEPRGSSHDLEENLDILGVN